MAKSKDINLYVEKALPEIEQLLIKGNFDQVNGANKMLSQIIRYEINDPNSSFRKLINIAKHTPYVPNVASLYIDWIGKLSKEVENILIAQKNKDVKAAEQHRKNAIKYAIKTRQAFEALLKRKISVKQGFQLT